MKNEIHLAFPFAPSHQYRLPVNPKVKVMIVDDHPLFRQGLRSVVQSDSRFELVAEAADGTTALKLLREMKPHVAVLDIHLPGLSGLDVARTIQSDCHGTEVVVLTMCKEEETFNCALDFGVKGFVLKENAVEEMRNALLAVSRGEHYLTPSISGYLVRRHTRAGALSAQKPGLSELTRAERRVLQLVAERKTSHQIAAEFFISVRTVEAHRANICSKLNLRGSYSLLQFALENRSAL